MSKRELKIVQPSNLVRWISLMFFILVTVDVGGLVGASEPGFSLVGLAYVALAFAVHICFWTTIMMIDAYRDRAAAEKADRHL